MGGEHRARVRVRELAGRWLTDGMLVLSEWVGEAPGVDSAREAREADRELLLQAAGRTG